MTDNVVKSAIDVLARAQAGTLQGVLVNEVDLSKHGLPGVHAADATFKRVALHDADATRSIFSRSKFTEASCRKVRFDHSLFRGTSFFNCELIEGRFTNTNLSGTTFFSCRLGNADFSGSRLQSSNFNSCELFGAKFARSVIVNSKFEAAERGNVTLDRADFQNAVLVDCDLAGANLFGANFKNALLIKVDLRHANIAQANFEGARLIDVQVDLTQLEPGERRMIERAKLDDPWRQHGFMREVLAPYSDEEMHAMLEYVLRTYVIEAAQPQADADSFIGLLQSIKARHDFPELENLRIRNGGVQVRFGINWYDLGAPIESGEMPEPADEDASPPPRPSPRVAASEAKGRPPMAEDGEARPKKADQMPPKVEKSKRFRKLEMD
ncbi:MAG: pentapeptide repeat-containing protein [Deltaproteobacteria bacterium]|nr:pentapeptide repeat-containing protein [Deltaproteobacteria bacterium]